MEKSLSTVRIRALYIIRSQSAAGAERAIGDINRRSDVSAAARLGMVVFIIYLYCRYLRLCLRRTTKFSKPEGVITAKIGCDVNIGL